MRVSSRFRVNGCKYSLPQLTCVIATIVVCSAMFECLAAESYPTMVRPSRLADLLPDPAKRILSISASMFHNEQLREVQSFKNGEQPWHCHFILGIVLALEEYHARELTYPSSAKDLCNSGYLSKEWAKSGLYVIDFVQNSSAVSDSTLVYLAQPIGEAHVTAIPGAECSKTMFSFEEYSLLIPTRFVQHWDADESEVMTSWVEPFLDFGYCEILHFNFLDIRRTKCACIAS